MKTRHLPLRRRSSARSQSSREAVRAFIKELSARVVERWASDRLFCFGAVVAGSNPRRQSFVLHATLAHWQPEWRSLGLVETYAQHSPSRTLVSALTATARSRDIELMSRLTQMSREPIPALDYVHAILERRFVDAYDIWRTLPEVDACLETLPTPANDSLSQSVAVVLPGPTEGADGADIDAHDVVARTTFVAPRPEESASIGKRTDIVFLNSPRLRTLVRRSGPVPISTDRIVTESSEQHSSIPNWLTIPIDFELRTMIMPASPFAYLPMKIIPWCHERGFRPTLMCADFYLGDSFYRSTEHDPTDLLAEVDDVLRSYARHDVFFTHAALRQWRQHRVVRSRGRLEQLLDLDGRAFAQAIQDRWGKVPS